MLSKDKLLKSIKDLPNQFSVEELLDRVILLQKIEIGLAHSEQGKVYSTKDAESKLKKWLM